MFFIGKSSVKCYGVSIFYNAESVNVHCVLLENKKGEIKTVETLRYQNIDELVSSLDHTIPISLFLGGDKVIVKKIKKQIENSSEVFLQIPGIKGEDFICDVENFSDYSFSAILRKSDFERLKIEFNKAKFHIVNFRMIPSVHSEYFPISENEYINVCYGIYNLELLGQNINSIENSTEIKEYTILNTILSSEYFPAFIAAIDFFKKSKNQFLGNLTDLIEYKYKILIKKVGLWTILVSLSAILVFVYFNNHYSKQLSGLKIARYKQLKIKKEADSLTLEINKINKLIKSKQSGGKTYLSFIADRIATVIPESINLLKMQIIPSEIKTNSIEFQQNVVIIEGKSNRNLALTGFISGIKKFTWVKSVKITDYHKDNENESAFFSLNIEFNDEEFN